MNRQQKEITVRSLKERFAESPVAFIIGYKGLSVIQMQGLRSELRKNGGALKVAKGRLLKRAVGDMEDEKALTPYLKNQIGVVFASDEASAIAKVLSSFAKDNNALELIAGTLDGALLNNKEIVRIATLPSKDVLRAQLCGTLQAPLNRLVFGLNMQIVQLLLVLKRIAEKK
jgi:large subunit ribosomal protein L10